MAESSKLVSGVAPVDGADLYYEMAGRGPSLILLHAGVADSRMWDPQFDDLALHFQVMRYDRRGFGKSNRLDNPFSHRRDLAKLMRFLGVPQAALLGCSQGGAVALAFTLEYPEKVTALILESSGVGGYPFTGPIPAPLVELAEALQDNDVLKAGELAVRIWLDGPNRSPNHLDYQLREQVLEMTQTALPNYFVAEEPLHPPALDQLSKIRIPTLVLAGDQDDPSVLAIADYLANGIAGSRKRIIPCTAHLPNLEKPQYFNRVVLEFLKDVLSPMRAA